MVEDNLTTDTPGLGSKAVHLARSTVEEASILADDTAYAARHLAQHIKDRPVESAIIALGVGYLLGKLF